MNLKKGFLAASVICFILAAFGAGGWPWIPVGLALLAAGLFVSS